MNVWQLVSYGLWIAFACGLGGFMYGVVLRVLGREDYGRFIAGGLASILVASFGWGLVQALYGGVAPPIPYGWVFYAIAGILLVSAGVYLAIGRLAEGSWSLIGALLIIGIGFFAASLTTGVEIGPGGAVSVNVAPSTTMLKNSEELGLTVIPVGGDPPYSVAVEWGDGSTSTGSTSTSITFTKRYNLPGNKPADSYTIRVNVVDAGGRTGFNMLAVTVQNQDYCPLGWPFNLLCGFYKLASAVVPAIDLQKLVECPLFPTSGELYDLYQFMLGASMGALGLFLAFNLTWSVVGREDVASGLVQSLKDAVVVVALALLAPYVYNATAQMLNTISYQLIGSINIGWVFAWVMLQIVLGVVIGYFVPFAAHYAAFMAFTLFLASVVVYIRYVLITTLVAASPLLAVAYLHPGLRGVVRHLVTLLAGLMLAGPIAAVFMVVLSKVVPGQDIVFGILYPLIVGALPSILGVFGAGAVGGITGAMRGVAGALGGAVGRALGRGGKEAGGAAVASTATTAETLPIIKLRAPTTPATPVRTAQYPKLETATASRPIAESTRTIEVPVDVSRPAPVLRPSMVKHARVEAGLRKQVAESVREMQELAPGIAYTLEGPEKARQVEEQVRQELVKPRWESLKAFTKDLATLSWRQLKTNMRAYGSEFYQGIRYFAERELGVKLPESIKLSLRREFKTPSGEDRIRFARRYIHDIAFSSK